MSGTWWSAHTHSQFSTLDGMTEVKELVHKAAMMGQPAIALTDHGNMAGSVQLYKAARKEGIAPFPGVEAYLIDPQYQGDLGSSAKVKRFHMGFLALDATGYQGLVKLVSHSHTRPRFNRFPRLALSDLASFSRTHSAHVAVTTGCYFGYLQQVYLTEGPIAAT